MGHMDDSSDGSDTPEAGRDEFVATMMLLAKVDRAAYRKLREMAWNHAQPLVVSEKAN